MGHLLICHHIGNNIVVFARFVRTANISRWEIKWCGFRVAMGDSRHEREGGNSVTGGARLVLDSEGDNIICTLKLLPDQQVWWPAAAGADCVRASSKSAGTKRSQWWSEIDCASKK